MTTALDKVLAASQVLDEAVAPQLSAEEEAAHTTELVEAAGSALAEACALFSAADLNGVPAEVLQGVAAVFACSAALDGLELTADQDWVESTALDVTALALAGDSSAPYGDVPYGDPGYQKDGKKRYPLDKSHIHAAIAYFSKPGNRSSYTAEQVKAIWGRIKAAASKLGVEMDDSTGKVAACQAVLELAAGGKGLPERVIRNHGKFHGAHEHDHLHLNDNRHGPGVMGLAAGNNMLTAHHHPPMTGVHQHAHVHANDATHGPMRSADESDNW